MTSTDTTKTSNTLNEYEAKKLLSNYDVPVVQEEFITDAKEVTAAADKTGYPVVLKGIAESYSHKSDAGLVHLNLENSIDVDAAVESLLSTGIDFDGFLIQQMIHGDREFVVGMNRDPHFGPVVMFGLGGIYTEVLRDTSFRIVPFGETDALNMVKELRASALLDEVRGRAAVDWKALTGVLTGISRLAEENPDIAEIDINPLIVEKNGNIVAVDALVVQQR